MDEKSEFYTADELAEMLKISKRTVQRIIRRKELPAIRIGRQWRLRREWVHKWLEQKTVSAESEQDEDTA